MPIPLGYRGRVCGRQSVPSATEDPPRGAVVMHVKFVEVPHFGVVWKFGEWVAVQEGALNSRRAESLLVRLVEEERWEIPDDPQGVVRHNRGGNEPNRTVTCMVLKATTNDRRLLALCHDEFHGPRSDIVRQVPHLCGQGSRGHSRKFMASIVSVESKLEFWLHIGLDVQRELRAFFRGSKFSL
ncbi:uncharacterized protein TNCV_3909121 [Trichonephila clavipes]|nr:uncharacterized protein TNCV_3909121 [Trichonephila clavipes]